MTSLQVALLVSKIRSFKTQGPTTTGVKALTTERIEDIIKNDKEKRYVRKSEPHVFYTHNWSTDKLLTMEQVVDYAHIPMTHERKTRPTGVTWGYKSTVWFTEHEFFKYARKPTEDYLYGIDNVLEVLPNAPTFKEIHDDVDFFDIMEHDKTGATYNPTTEEVCFWYVSSKVGSMVELGAAPDSVYTLYYGEETEEKQTVYLKGYKAARKYCSVPKQFLYYTTTIDKSNLGFYDVYSYTHDQDPSITYHIINGGILRVPRVEDDDEVVVVPPPPRPVPEIYDLTHVPDEPSTCSAVDTLHTLPVMNEVERSAREGLNVPVQVEEDSKPSRKRRFIPEDESDNDNNSDMV